MGKVFSIEELRRAEVPAEGAHYEAADYIMDHLFNRQCAYINAPRHPDTGLVAGMVHGSVSHGSATIRSDVDTLLIVKPDKTGVIERALKVFNEVQQRYHVPIETNVITTDNVQAKAHSIDPLFLRYLLEAEWDTRYRWNKPASEVAKYFDEGDMAHVALARTVQRYTAAKSAKFSKALVLPQEADLHSVQRALELPKNLGRKVLSMCNEDFAVQVASGEDILLAFKRFIYALQVEQGANTDPISYLQELSELDDEYNVVLAKTIQADLSLSDYWRWLEGTKHTLLLLALQASNATQPFLAQYQREITSLDWPNKESDFMTTVFGDDSR